MDDGSDQVEELTLERGEAPRARRTHVLWAVLAVVAVAAGALVVTSANDDEATRPALPVALGSVVARAEGATADSMPASVTYVAGDDLPVLGGQAPAYRLGGTVTEERVRALADALGLEGDLVHDGPGWVVSGIDGTLEVYEGGVAQWWYSAVGSSSAGGSAGCAGGATCTTVTTRPECTASDGPAECLTGECPPGTDCAISPTTTIACGPGAECVAPEPPSDPDCAVTSDRSTTCPDDTGTPVDLPSADEARAIALDLLTATGMDVDGAEVTVEGPSGAWYVGVEPRVDGVPSGLRADVTVGGGGAVEAASGHLAVPEALGDYPLLDTRAAIDRANDQGGGAGDVPAVGTDTTVAGVVTGTDPAGEDPCAGDGACDGLGGVPSTTVPACKVQADGSELCEPVVPGVTCPQVDSPRGAPEPVTCTPPVPDPGGPPAPVPEPIEVLLVDAEPSLMLVGAVDGSTDAYLLPAYRFTADDGSLVELAAIADSELTAPPTTGTSAPDPAPEPAPVEPQPCEVLVEGDATGTTHTVQPYPGCVEPEPELQVLEEGASPEVGVGYYVDVQVDHCSYVELGGWFWTPTDVDPGQDGWSQPTEGGTFTLRSESVADFVGDAGKLKVGTFERVSTDGIACA